MEEAELCTGFCPDPKCGNRITFFQCYDQIQCGHCRQTHAREKLLDVKKIRSTAFQPTTALIDALKGILSSSTNAKLPKRGPDSIEVNGLSNYHCKLISRFLTHYGMDKSTGQPKLLSDMNRGDVLDCSVLGSKAFQLESEHMDILGFGKDNSGSLQYLSETLSQIYSFNEDRKNLIPIHVDGDGHCLVHAISRAITGRELFWHPLRENLRRHFSENQSKYRELFKDFIDADEWPLIINECHPDYVPLNGEPLGMRNIHIFGLANVLHRPIILLDSLAGIQSLGDYTGVFLPCLVDVDQCKDSRDGSLNKPLCIAWSSLGRNHYIPLVAVKTSDPGTLPRLPRQLLPQVWGVDGTYLDQYIEFDQNDSCVIGGSKCMKDEYFQKLAGCMDRLFQAEHGVSARDVVDVHHYIVRASNPVDNSSPDQIIEFTRRTLQEHRLYRCLQCDAVSEYHIDREDLVKGGNLYEVAVRDHGSLKPGYRYVFSDPTGVTCDYDEKTDSLILDWSSSQMSSCPFCQSEWVRRMLEDGSVVYMNGDRTNTPAPNTTCPCGFKHWWDGYERDNQPRKIPVVLEWAGSTVQDEVYWFENETDPSLNSNVYTIAQELVEKHFPGEFGSERIVQRVVNSLIAKTQSSEQTTPVVPECSASGVTEPTSHQVAPVVMKKSSSSRRLDDETTSGTARAELARAQQNSRIMQKRKSAANNDSNNDRQTSLQRSAPPTKSTNSAPPVTSPTKVLPQKSARESRPPSSGPDKSVNPKSDHDSSKQDGEKKVKVQASDGRQCQLSIVPQTTLSDLQALIEAQFHVPSAEQKLRCGFPPRELADCCPLPVHHGDKILLEIVKPKAEVRVPSPECGDPVPQGDMADWIGLTFRRLTADKKRLSASALEKLVLTINDRVRGMDIDAVNEAYLSLSVTVRVAAQHLDLWTIVQQHSRLFESGGLFYRHASGDIPMEHGHEFEIRLLPGKRFRYNADGDRCEVYVHPFGYYPVQKDVDNQVTVNEWRNNPQTISSWTQESRTFQGQGHSLRSDPQGQTTDTTSMDWSSSSKSDYDWDNWSSGAFQGQGQKLGSNSGKVQGRSDLSYLSKEWSGDGVRRIGPGYSVMEGSGEGLRTSEEEEQIKRTLAGFVQALAQVYGAEDDDEEEDEVAPPKVRDLNESCGARELARTGDSAGEDDDMDSDGGYT